MISSLQEADDRPYEFWIRTREWNTLEDGLFRRSAVEEETQQCSSSPLYLLHNSSAPRDSVKQMLQPATTGDLDYLTCILLFISNDVVVYCLALDVHSSGKAGTIAKKILPQDIRMSK